MKNRTRTEKSLMNAFTGVFGQMVSFVASFIVRTIFVYKLGETYLGLNGLFTNILSVLNISELGIGTAIVLDMYRTVSQKDEEKTKQYLELYKKIYRCIGVFIICCGMILLPFLKYFINDIESVAGINYHIIFLFYLFNSAFSYLCFSYRESIIQANQMQYKTGIISYMFKIAEMLLQVITLTIFGNIYVYLVIPLALGCISNVVKGVLIGKWYPFIKKKPFGKLTKTEITTTAKNVYGVALYKLSGTVINSTDNIILSSFVSLTLTGLYSNYLILIDAVRHIVGNIFGSVTSGLGTLNVEAGEDIERKYEIFSILSFLNFWIYGFCATGFFVLLGPFVKIWIGERFALNGLTEAMIIFNFLVTGLQETVGTHRAAYGLFYKGRYRPIVSVLVNIVASILFVNVFPAEYGVVAVLLGTVVSNLFVTWWFDAYMVFKHAFHRKPYKFYIVFWLRMIYILGTCLLCQVICSMFELNVIATVIVNFIVCTAVFNLLFILLFNKKKEFKYLINFLTPIIKQIRGR